MDVSQLKTAAQNFSSGEGQTILKDVLLDGTEFLEGEPIDTEIALPTTELFFTEKNPFGVSYAFQIGVKGDGKGGEVFYIKGTPQGS